MSATASIDSQGPDDGLGTNTMRVRSHDDVEIVGNNVILDVTSDAAFVSPAAVAAAARANDEVLDGLRDPVMPVVILGMISFLAIVAIAAMLAL